MGPIRTVTVYCSSSNKIATIFFDAAKQLGAAIARSDWTLVYGGNRLGLMGALADAVQSRGGRVVGVTPQYFVDLGVGDDRADELVVTANLRDRKALLETRGDALIALPGGVGTLEEFFDVLVGKSLGFHAKPIVLLNVAGFFNPLLAMIDAGVEQQFIRPKTRRLFYVAATVNDCLDYLRKTIADPPSRPSEAEISAAE